MKVVRLAFVEGSLVLGWRSRLAGSMCAVEWGWGSCKTGRWLPTEKGCTEEPLDPHTEKRYTEEPLEPQLKSATLKGVWSFAIGDRSLMPFGSYKLAHHAADHTKERLNILYVNSDGVAPLVADPLAQGVCV